ncbi:MAG TPA: hypothetical protein DEQ06_04775 [Porphyromonadaceae bacterium]|nr:hypothetical protein [Porphyromonadaceae bacterium]
MVIPAKWAALGSLALPGACRNQEKEPQRPNIIFIMSDDHAYQAINAYGYGLKNKRGPVKSFCVLYHQKAPTATGCRHLNM